MRTCYGEVSGKDSSETHYLRRETRTSVVFLLRRSRAVTTADLSLNPYCCRVTTAHLYLNPHGCRVTGNLSLNPHCCRLTGNLYSHLHCCRVTGNLPSNPRYSCVKMNCRDGHCLAKVSSLCLSSRPPTFSAALSAQLDFYEFGPIHSPLRRPRPPLSCACPPRLLCAMVADAGVLRPCCLSCRQTSPPVLVLLRRTSEQTTGLVQ